MSRTLTQEEVPGVKAALVRYRVMAYTVGTLLVALVCFAMPMKYVGGDDRLVAWIGSPHGWLYMLLLASAFDLGRRVGWGLKWFVGIMAAGTIPFLSFVAEWLARRDVRRRIAAIADPDGLAQPGE